MWQRSRRTTRNIIRIALAAFCFTTIAWVHSHWWMVHVEHWFGSTVAPGAVRGEPDMWTFRARKVFANSFGGGLTIGFSEYRSLAPTAEELSNWQSYRGWDVRHLSRSHVKPNDHKLVYWDSITSFSFLGLGTYATMRQGEEDRLVTIPYWLLVGSFLATWTALYVPTRRREHRASRGLCIRCGYDLAGNPARCPECGNEQVPSPA